MIPKALVPVIALGLCAAVFVVVLLVAVLVWRIHVVIARVTKATPPPALPPPAYPSDMERFLRHGIDAARTHAHFDDGQRIRAAAHHAMRAMHEAGHLTIPAEDECIDRIMAIMRVGDDKRD